MVGLKTTAQNERYVSDIFSIAKYTLLINENSKQQSTKHQYVPIYRAHRRFC
jgi:hypothetical protein